MSEETQKAMEALGIDAGGPDKTNPDDGGTDYKARCAELERQLASARVDEGRVRKLDAELKARDARIAELEKATVLGSLPENLQDVPDAVKETALLLSKDAAQKAVAGMDGRMAQLEKSVEEDRRRRLTQMSNEFVARINSEFPGFAKGLKEGGSFKAAWDQFLSETHVAASVREAFANLDADALMYHIRNFYEFHGVDPSGGQDPNAAPDPRSMGGGAGAKPQAGGKKVYTPEEWESEYDNLQDQYDRGTIGPKAYAEQRQVLMDAYKEGRVKAAAR